MIEQSDDDSNGNTKEGCVLNQSNEESSDTDFEETSFQSFG